MTSLMCSGKLGYLRPPGNPSNSGTSGINSSWELASSLKESKELFNSAGVKLIAVGVGTPDKARLLAERLPFPVDILYADPDRKTKVFSRIGELKKAMI